MIPKTTNSDLAWDMMGENWKELTARMKHNAAEKWFARREYREPEELMIKQKLPNYLKGIPNTWSKILKQQCQLCPECKKDKTSTRNTTHMKREHQILGDINAN